jgi:ADP-ribosyl-[dinitrogen reductase] hydrolase
LKGLIETVNYGGDCDTTGAIYGALAGARNGTGMFPESWKKGWNDIERLYSVADGIYSLGDDGDN